VKFARATLCFALCTSAIAVSARATPKLRRFEPDDLELEHPGTLDIDLQAGPMGGDSDGRNRVLLPDFELGLGLARNVQLEVDGTFSIDQFDGNGRHYTGDSLWVATKLGLFDEADDDHDVWAIGLELGPRFPTLDAGGLGYGAVALFGLTRRRLQLVANTGVLIDPGTAILAQHSESIVLGLDSNLDLDPAGIWSLQGELATAYYLSPDPHELTASFGATYAVTPRLDVSLMGLAGFLPRTDHAGILLGISPQFDLW